MISNLASKQASKQVRHGGYSVKKQNREKAAQTLLFVRTIGTRGMSRKDQKKRKKSSTTLTSLKRGIWHNREYAVSE